MAHGIPRSVLHQSGGLGWFLRFLLWLGQTAVVAAVLGAFGVSGPLAIWVVSVFLLFRQVDGLIAEHR